jgi:hypothetical protein
MLRALPAVDVGLVCYYRRLVHSIGVSRSIIILCGNYLPFEQFLAAPPGDLGQVKRCPCLVKLSLRLVQFLIDFGSVNLGQNITRLDLGPNIDIPDFQVPARYNGIVRFDSPATTNATLLAA